MSKYNIKRCSPPLPEQEVKQICKDVYEHQLSKLESGNGKSDGNGEGEKQKKNKDKNQKELTNKKISIKKYSQNGKGTLYESVVIGEKSKFVYLDKDKKPEFLDEIPRVNDILIPDDTIDTTNPIPFVFDSKEDLEQSLEDAKKETFDSLFSKVESINKLYVDIEDHYHVLFTASMIWTWLQDKFGYTHYNIIVGDNGSGKNSQLLVFRYLGYRVFYVVSASAANYYTKMGNVEEGQITIAEDEAEDIAINREKRNVWKSGYCSGGTIPKVELEGGRKSEDWLTYCQKWAVMEELSNHKEMKGILDRSFVSSFVAGDPQYNIKDVIKSTVDPKFKPLYNQLIKTRKILFCWRLLHYNDPIPDVDLNVKNRTAELTKPLIKLFQNSPIALEKILDSLSKFMIERNEIKKNSFESKLYEVIDELKKEREQRFKEGKETDEDKALREYDTAFTNPALLEKTIDVMDCKVTETPNVYWSSEVSCKISQTKITSVSKSKFKAKPFAKKLPDRDNPDKDKTVRCLEYEEKYLNRIKSTYEMPDKIEIITESEKVTPVTPITLPTDIQVPVRETSDVEITPKVDNILENSYKNKKNPSEITIDEDPKDPKHPTQV